MRARALLLSAAAALALWADGCGDDDDSGDSGESGGELTVSAAASLTDAFPQYGETIDGEERVSFAGSDELAAQIRQGATPDVFASANTTYPDELYAEDLVEKPVVFARNQLVVAVPADSVLESINDLTEPGLDVVIGAKGVPVGDYAREVLGRLPQADSRRSSTTCARRSPTSRASSASSPRARPTQGSSTSPTSPQATRCARSSCRPTSSPRSPTASPRSAKPRTPTARRRSSTGSWPRGPADPRGQRLPARALRLRLRWFPLLLAGALCLALVFLTLPIAAIFLQVGPGELIDRLGDPQATDALRLSLITSGIALALILLVGTRRRT